MTRWFLVFVGVTVLGCGGNSPEIDAGRFDAAQVPLPDAGVVDVGVVDVKSAVDVAPPIPDAAPPIDGCEELSDVACEGSVGPHCTAAGSILTCSLLAGCFEVTTAATSCPDGQTCPIGGTACECVTDPRCAAGAGTYCDGVTGAFVCAVNASGCLVSGADMECAAPEVCVGAGSCVCPVAGASVNQGCKRRWASRCATRSSRRCVDLRDGGELQCLEKSAWIARGLGLAAWGARVCARRMGRTSTTSGRTSTGA